MDFSLNIPTLPKKLFDNLFTEDYNRALAAPLNMVKGG